MTMKAIIAVAALAALAGCSSPGYKEGDSAAGAMRAAAAEATSVQTSVDSTLTSLRDLMSGSGGDLRPRYDVFSANVDQLARSVSALQKRSADVSSKAGSHLKGWEEQLKKVTSDDLRQRSSQRRSEVQDRLNRVTSLTEETKARTGPALTDLEDIRRVLGTDLTAGGIASARDAAQRAEASCTSLKDSSGRLSSELDILASDISSMAPAPSPSEPPPPALPEPQK